MGTVAPMRSIMRAMRSRSMVWARGAVFIPRPIAGGNTATASSSSYSLYQNILNGGGQQSGGVEASGYGNELFSSHFGAQEQSSEWSDERLF